MNGILYYFIGYHISEGDKTDKKEIFNDENNQNDGNLSQNGRHSPGLDSPGL